MAANEKVGIEVELLGGEEALALLKRIDSSIDTLNKKRKFKSLSGLKSAKGELEDYISELQKLQKEEKKWQDLAKKVGKENMSAFGVREWDRVKGKIEETNGKIKQMSAEMDEVTIKTRTFGQMFKSASSSVAHIGSAMQSLGNSLVRLTSPFRRLTSGLLMGAGYKALNLFTEGLGNTFGRADTMTKYTKMMKEYETANYTAAKSRDDLDASVQGLPIALDDAISLAQRYTLSLGDMERGTKLAIATNNAFLASMATEQQRYQGMLQLQDLMNGKDLTSREWMSLGSSMGKAINEVGLKLGYGRDELGAFRQELYAGEIASKDFLDALIEVGTGEGSLVSLARLSAETWEGLFSNVRIAITRMGEGVIKTLNKTFKKATGRTLLQQLLGIDAEGNDMKDGVKHWIDDLSKSVQNWVKAHPDEIIGFFNDLKAIDWKGLAKGLAEGAMELARLVSAFAKWASGKDLSKLGKWLPRLNILGNGLLVLGGFLKGTRHIWGLLGAFINYKFQGKGGLFGKIREIFGKSKDIESAKSIPTAAETFKGVINSLSGLMKVSGAVLMVGFTGFASFKFIKSMIQDLGEIMEISSGIDWDRGAATLLAMGTALTIAIPTFSKLGSLLGKEGLLGVGAITGASLLVTGGFAGDMWFLKTGVQQFKQMVQTANEIVDEINKLKSIENIDDIKTKLKDTVQAMNDVADIFKGKTGSKMDRGVVEKGIPTFSSVKTNSFKNIGTVINSMKSMVRSINSLAKKTVNVDGFSELIGQLKEALAELDGMSEVLELDIEVKLAPKFMASVKHTITVIKQAKNSIKTQTQQQLAFSIPVAVTFSVSSNLYSALQKINREKQTLIDSSNGNVTNYGYPIGPPRNPAKGGLIYRSKGGGIPWKRRGTDTVPAMLTPGEYVHNRRAVNTFGIDFMRKVNNLDIKGAMNELMHRAGSMANVNRGTSIVNNYNNNQKVVINNNGNTGAGFTFKRASRFVGAI